MDHETQFLFDQIAAPLNTEDIKQRQGPGGIMLDYVEWPTVVKRLNEATSSWSWEVKSITLQNDSWVCVGTLTIEGISRDGIGCAPLKSNDVDNGAKAAESGPVI